MIINRLRYIRMRQYELSQKDFAELLKVPYVTYNNYENGNIIPSLETALKISKKLKTPVDKIFYLTK